LKNESFPASQGEQVRDFLFVEDVANALVVMAEKYEQGIFNTFSS
jgi:nucleoside-diphosphate-sugar epimerase